MCRRLVVGGRTAQASMARTRRSTIASPGGANGEFGKAYLPPLRPLPMRPGKWRSTAAMSKSTAAPVAEKGGAGPSDRHHQRRPQQQDLRGCRRAMSALGVGPYSRQHSGLCDGRSLRQPDPGESRSCWRTKAMTPMRFARSLRTMTSRRSFPENQTERNASVMTKKPTKVAMSSSAASAASKTSDASQPATTSSPETSSRRSASWLLWPTGCDLVESRP